jgi:AcrR family transcriptional regulator
MKKEQLGEALRDMVMEKLTEKKAQNERSFADSQKASAKARLKAELKAEAIDAITEQLSALDLWTRVPPQSRRPRLTREDLAATAMRIADADGLDALSMRRLATELDVGTMTLYHYVRTKDELLTLVTDAVMGEVVLPPDDPVPADWRAAVTAIAERTRAALERHPWILDITDDPPIGPNSVRHIDQSLQAVASLPLPLADKFDIVTAVDEYVFGHCLMQRNNLDADEDFDDEMIAYVNDLVATGDYPQLAALAEERGLAQGWTEIADHLRDPTRFARNLRRLLDGIEADVGRA